jgi:aldose 1-epimerase
MNLKNKFWLIFALSFVWQSCLVKKKDESNQTSTESKEVNKIERKAFGNHPNGKEAELFTLKNENGMTVNITNYGGIITNIIVPDRNGTFGDVVLGYESMDGYLKKPSFFGCIVGRYGNRIAKGRFTLDGQTYKLAINNIGNHLHGGLVGFDKMLWDAETMDGKEPALKLSYVSKDGEEGYPGNLTVTVTYTLTNQNALKIDYKAFTDKATVINLTNHSYFNLSDMKTDILNHEVTLNADRFLPVDNTLIPTGELKAVAGTPFDFTKQTAIGARIDDTTDQQIKFGGGYDHCYVLNKKDKELSAVGSVIENTTGRKMDVFTTEPAVQFYTGNFLDGSVIGKNGVKYGKRFSFCLETQHYPDSPNQSSFPSTVLRPDEEYNSTTIYQFSVVK